MVKGDFTPNNKRIMTPWCFWELGFTLCILALLHPGPSTTYASEIVFFFLTVPLSSLGWTMMWMVQTLSRSRKFDSFVSSDLNTELSGCWLSPLLLTHVSILHAAKWCGHALKTSDSDENINSRHGADEKTDVLEKIAPVQKHLLVKAQTNTP